jgi:hypothetical protein
MQNMDFEESVMARGRNGSYIRYGGDTSPLIYACPSCTSWRDTVVGARLNIIDAAGRLSDGIYVDMIGATRPQICDHSLHDHVPGDPLAWQLGTRDTLSRIPGVVMSEGVAEIYLDLVDHSLMHMYTDRSDGVPLWNVVYGFLKRSVGWSISKSAGPREIEAEVERAVLVYGARCLSSPWMSSAIQDTVQRSGDGLLDRLVALAMSDEE